MRNTLDTGNTMHAYLYSHSLTKLYRHLSEIILGRIKLFFVEEIPVGAFERRSRAARVTIMRGSQKYRDCDVSVYVRAA